MHLSSDPTVATNPVGGNAGIFGPIVTEKDVRAAVEGTVKMWLPTYCHEVAARQGHPRTFLPAIRSWRAWPEFTKWPEDQLPAVVVVTPGTNDPPEKLDRQLSVSWTIGVGIIVAARDADSTADLIGMYAAAVRVLLTHKGSLGGFAEHSEFVAERYDDALTQQEMDRTLRTAMVTYSVLVKGIHNRFGGPKVPDPTDDPPEDPGDWPIITHVDETIVPLEG